MKENRYDDPVFFRKYSEMARSRLGLEGAGEWKTLRPMLPDFTGKRVLDLGCGYGWHAFYAAENGAEKVLGIDLSEKMLAVAREKNTFPNVRFARGAMEDVRFPDGSFDAVLSSLALHYVKDYAELVSRVYRWLAPGGASSFRPNTRPSPPMGTRTGTTPRRGKSSTSRSTGISTKGSGRRSSSARR